MIYYKTTHTTKTGKKFLAILEKADKANNAQREFADKVGATSWRIAPLCAWGGISSLMFPHEQEIEKHFKQVRPFEYMPKMSFKKGKELQKEIDALPAVQFGELNKCIGMKGEPFKSIGFSFSQDRKTFAFSVRPKWGVKIPKHCTEITHTEFEKISL